MGKTDLWAIVEGRDHDRTHYERLLKALPETRDLSISVRLAEQITIEGSATGGKTHALALHGLYERENSLMQSNREGDRRIVFMVDRDRDDVAGKISTSRHVIYTVAVDVESDILLNSDLWLALESAYGLASDSSQRVARAVGDPRDALLALWEDWIRLGLLAVFCEAGSQIAYGQFSTVNTPPWGRVDPQLVSSTEERIRRSIEQQDFERASERASSHIAQNGRLLLKGRWIARYVWELVRVHLADEVVRSNVEARSIIDSAIGTLDYGGGWSAPYRRSFGSLLAP